MQRFARRAAVAALLASSLPLAAQEGGAPPANVDLQVVTVEDVAKKASPASVGSVTDLAQIPDDFWTHGGYGDLLLKNDFAAFLFGQIPAEAADENAARQGAILDIFAAPSSAENFQLLQLTTSGKRTRTTMATGMTTATDAATGKASVTVSGKDTSLEGLTFETKYEMEKSWPGVLATTTLRNTGKAPLTLPVMGDYVGWGAMGLFVPGTGWLSTGAELADLDFVMGRLYDSYIIMAPKSGKAELQYSGEASTMVYEKNVTINPGEARSFARWIGVAQGDPGKLMTFLCDQKKREEWGYLAGMVNERVRLADGTIQESGFVPNAEVRVSAIVRPDLPSRMIGKPYFFGRADHTGRFQFSLPVGEYLVTCASFSRFYKSDNLATKIKPERPAVIDMGMTRSATLTYEIVDADTGKPLPAKISLVPMRGTMPAEFGPPGSIKSASAFYSQTGRGVVDVPQGNFRVVASHGVEYHMDEKRVSFQTPKNETIRFELKRAFNPEGWISADAGVLTNASPQSRTTPEDRVVSSVCEGLDWIVTADAGTPTDLAPAIARLGLEDRIRASKGFRLTSSVDRPVGDYLLFPLETCSSGPNADFSAALAAKTPGEAIKALRNLCPSSVLMANRPLFPMVGSLTMQGYDAKYEALPATPIEMDFDVMQIWEGKRQGIVASAIRAYYQLLARGGRLSPIANSLSAGTYSEEPGYPRIYIRSSQSDPRRLDLDELVRNIKQGLVQITNGPFIDVKVNGQPMGSLVSDSDGAVDVDLQVYSPNWAAVNSITINLNGNFVRKFILPVGTLDNQAGLVYPRADKPDDGKFRIQVKKDSILTVMVEGDVTLSQDPVNPNLVPSADPKVRQGQRSLAISAPVFIDADGDGKLDVKIPVETIPENDPIEVPPF